MNNGTASNYFPLERGVWQGDPLSPYPFIVVVETLAINCYLSKSRNKRTKYREWRKQRSCNTQMIHLQCSQT